MEEGLKIIKKIDPMNCPHCNEQIFITTQSMPSTISCIASKADMDNAKNAVKIKMDGIKFVDKEEKKKIIDWLNDEETLIDFSDVEGLIKQISEDQSSEIIK